MWSDKNAKLISQKHRNEFPKMSAYAYLAVKFYTSTSGHQQNQILYIGWLIDFNLVDWLVD